MAEQALLSPPVRAAVEAVEALIGERPVDLAEAVALEDVRALLRAKEQLDAHLLRRLRDVDNRQLHDADALPSAGSWVEAQTTSMSRRDVVLARRLGRLPAVEREIETGRLSLQVARRLAAAVERVRGFLDRPDGRIDGLPGEDVLKAVVLRGVPTLYAEALGGLAEDDPRLRALLTECVGIFRGGGTQLGRVEAAFVALAVRVESAALWPALSQLMDALLPQQLEDRSERRTKNRALTLLHDDEDGWLIEGSLSDELGERMHAALTAAMATDPEKAADTEAAQRLRAEGLEPYESALPTAPRPIWQRRHDALDRILRDWLDSGIAGLRDKVAPHMLVRVGLETLHGAPGALPAVGGSGKTLPLSLVRELLCDSVVTRFVMGIGNRVIEMSHSVRTLKAHERKAKLMETGGVCQAAGCRPPPGTPLVPHHPDPYARSQSTSFEDSVLLCESSHHDVHHGKVVRLKDGRLLGPAGWVAESVA